MSPALAGRAADAAGLLLLLVSQVALAVVADRRGLVACWALAAVAALAWPRRVRVAQGMTLLYLALPHAVVARLWTVRARGIDLSLGFYVALYLQTLGVLALLGPRGPARMARLLGVSGLSLAAMGTDADRGPYLALSAAWGAVALAALRLERAPALDATPAGPAAAAARAGRARAMVVAACAALVLGGAAALVRVIDANYEQANQLFFRLARGLKAPRGSGGGFSNQAALGSVVALQGAEGDDVALRAFGPSAPGYLRAKAFLRYEGGRWTPARDDAPDGARRATQAGRAVLPGRVPPRDRAPAYSVQPAGRYGQHLFLPLAAAEVRGLGDDVVDWPGGVLTSPGTSTARGYDVVLDAAPLLAEGDDPVWRALPADAALLAALDRTLADAGLVPAAAGAPPPPAEAVTRAVVALSRHTARRWRYQVGIDLDPRRDPVAQFLLEQDHGHCELFAAAGTLLLRRLGVPARYVTGFVVDEASPYGAVWLARGRHAHAWCEAFAPGAGWQTVELTPSSGVPATAPAAGGQALREWLEAQLARVTGLARRLDVAALLGVAGEALRAALVWLVGSWWRALLLAAAVAALLARAWRRRLAARAPARVLPPALARERAEVAALERRLARRGLGRGPAETLLAWADRVEAAPGLDDGPACAARVRAYAGRRFARSLEACAPPSAS